MHSLTAHKTTKCKIAQKITRTFCELLCTLIRINHDIIITQTQYIIYSFAIPAKNGFLPRGQLIDVLSFYYAKMEVNEILRHF